MDEADGSKESGSLTIRREGGTVVVGVNRPRRLNALDRVTVVRLTEYIRSFDFQSAPVGIVLHGVGPGFSAGGDLVDISEATADGDIQERLVLMRQFHELLRAIWWAEFPVIAAVNGPVYGAAFNLVLATDLVVASEDAEFCQPFHQLDVVPDMGGLWLLPRIVGVQRAKEMFLKGSPIEARVAQNLGIVNEVVRIPSEVVPRAVALAEEIGRSGGAVVGMTKNLVNRSLNLGFDEALDMEMYAQSLALGSSAAKHSIGEFLESKGRRRISE